MGRSIKAFCFSWSQFWIKWKIKQKSKTNGDTNSTLIIDLITCLTHSGKIPSHTPLWTSAWYGHPCFVIFHLLNLGWPCDSVIINGIYHFQGSVRRSLQLPLWSPGMLILGKPSHSIRSSTTPRLPYREEVHTNLIVLASLVQAKIWYWKPWTFWPWWMRCGEKLRNPADG